MKSQLFLVIAILLVFAYGCQDETTSNEAIAPVQNSDAPVVETTAGLDGPAQEFPLEMSNEAKNLTLTDYPITQNPENADAVTTRSNYSIDVTNHHGKILELRL
jgi:hypothetical protein